MDTHERQTLTSLSNLRDTKALEFGEPDHAQSMQLYTVEYPNLHLNGIADDLDSNAKGAFFINPPGFACPHRLGYVDPSGQYMFFETAHVESCFFNGQIIPGKISFKVKEKDARFIIDLNTNKVELISANDELKDALNLMFLPNKRNHRQASESNKIRTDIQERFGVPCIYLRQDKYINRDSIIGLLTGKIRSAFYNSSNKTWALHHINITEKTTVFDEMLKSGDFSNFSFAHLIRPYTPEAVAHEYTLLWGESADAYHVIGKLSLVESLVLSENTPLNRQQILGLLNGTVLFPGYHLKLTKKSSRLFDKAIANNTFDFTCPMTPLQGSMNHTYMILEKEPHGDEKSLHYILGEIALIPDSMGTLDIAPSESIVPPTTQSATREQQFSSKAQMKKELLKATIAGDTDTVFQIITSEAERLTKGDLARVFANALNKGHIAIAKKLIQNLDQNVINDQYIKAKNCQEIRDLLRPFVSARYQGY